MSSKTSPVDPDVVRKIAGLARLALPDAELGVWTQQLGRIVSYIDQLKELPEEAAVMTAAPATPLRADLPREGTGRLALEQNAPELSHDYVAVPRIVAGSSSEPESRPAPSRAPERA